MSDIIYLRGKIPKVLKNCFYHRKYEDWMRELSSPYNGVEYLDEKKVIAVIDTHNVARPQDDLEKYSNDTIEKWVNVLGFKTDKTGLFYCNGKYRTWEEREGAQQQDQKSTICR